VPLIAKPLSRDEFLLGKVAGLAFTLFVNVACMSLGLAATLFLTRRSPGWSLLFAILPIYLNLILVVALAVLFSTMTSSMMAVICTMSLTVAGRFSDILRNARQVLPGTPRWLTETLYYLLPNFRNFDFKDRVIYGDPFASGELLWVGGYAAAYIGALLTLSLVIFRKKELP
jgi:ABC-type transport system involved in multi-copper enzyme maturation permease subunit